MPVPLLTKSRYILASECPRKLWYHARPAEYPNEKSDDAFLQALADGGHQIGALARCLFPDGELIETRNIEAALAQTAELLRRDEVVIFEAALQSGPFLVLVDVLRKTKTGYELMEVKAKSWDPAKDSLNTKKGLRSEWVRYLEDVAFQTWVARQALPGSAVVPYLILVNKSAITEADGLNQLFRLDRDANRRVTVRIVDPQRALRLGQDLLAKIPVAAEVEGLINGTAGIAAEEPGGSGSTLPERALRFSQIQNNTAPIAAPIGPHCKSCEFRCSTEDISKGLRDGFGECWTERLGKEYRPDRQPVFSLWNFGKNKVKELSDRGHWYLDQIPPGQVPDKNQRQIRQWQSVVNRTQEEYINRSIAAAIDSWRYPIHFLDFETITPSIPFHRGMHPYEVVAFQFSCHHLQADGSITHDEFLDVSPGTFPTWRFLESLKRSIGQDGGTILRFAPHENSVLRAVRSQLLRAQRSPSSSPTPFPAGMQPDEYVAWIDTITTPTGSEEKGSAGPRTMVDLLPLVKDHYFHPKMGGSNSIKALLPAVLSVSNSLREKYQKPLGFGTNLTGKILWQPDDENGGPRDPYALLPPVFPDFPLEDSSEEDADPTTLASGGAAMMAYARIQYADVPIVEREAYGQALLRYCELDTLAMLMVVEHWRSAQPSP